MVEVCAFVSDNGIACELDQREHRIRGWHMAWDAIGRVPTLKMAGDFVPLRMSKETGDA